MVKNRVSPFSGKTSFPQNAQKSLVYECAQLTYAVPPEVFEWYISVPASQQVEILSVEYGGVLAP